MESAKEINEISKVKGDIAKRLRESNRTLWGTINEEDRSAIVNEYYNSFDINKVGLSLVLEHNRNVRISLATLLMGLMLGLLGALVANVIQKYIPNALIYDAVIVLGFIAFLWWFIRDIEKTSAELLKEDKVLEYLLKLVNKR